MPTFLKTHTKVVLIIAALLLVTVTIILSKNGKIDFLRFKSDVIQPGSGGGTSGVGIIPAPTIDFDKERERKKEEIGWLEDEIRKLSKYSGCPSFMETADLARRSIILLGNELSGLESMARTDTRYTGNTSGAEEMAKNIAEKKARIERAKETMKRNERLHEECIAKLLATERKKENLQLPNAKQP